MCAWNLIIAHLHDFLEGYKCKFWVYKLNLLENEILFWSSDLLLDFNNLFYMCVFTRHVFKACCMPGIVLNTKVSKVNKFPALCN